VSDEVRVTRVVVEDDGTTCDVEWKGDHMTLHTPLVGDHQAANLAFALVMLDAAGSSYAVGLGEAARHLDRVHVPGRFQHVGHFIFDVAHNPAGADVVAQTLAAVSPPRPITALVCVLRDKDWREMIRVLSRVVDRFVLTMAPTAPASRAWDLTEAAEFTRSLGVDVDAIADFDAALEMARTNSATVLVTGSFHTVGDAMSRLQVSPLRG
jgi:dihydrofolate synthase/folylpolyglutamate synthase